MGDYWKGGSLEDSSDLDGASPPGYSSGEGFGFKAKQQATEKGKTSGEDDYDFEIEGGILKQPKIEILLREFFNKPRKNCRRRGRRAIFYQQRGLDIKFAKN